MGKKEIIRTIYLYLFSLVGLVLVVVGAVKIVDLGLKAFVFKNAEQTLNYPEMPRPAVDGVKKTEESKVSEEEQAKFKKEQEEFQKKDLESRRERDAAGAVAMMLVGAPLFLYHWKLVQKSREE